MTEENAATQTEDQVDDQEIDNNASHNASHPNAETASGSESSSENTSQETQETEPSEDDKAKAERQRKRDKTQKRINQLTREKKEAQAEAEKLRQELTQHQQVHKPNPDDFETQDDYIDAQVEYRLSQTKQPEVQAPTMPNFGNIVHQGKEKYSDFEKVAMTDPNLTQQVANTVAMADNADDIFYHLGKNSTELERISLLDPAQMAREIGRLEATVSIPTPRQTKTPEPVKPLENAESVEVDDSKLSMEEWAKRRNKTRWSKGKI